MAAVFEGIAGTIVDTESVTKLVVALRIAADRFRARLRRPSAARATQSAMQSSATSFLSSGKQVCAWTEPKLQDG